MGLLSFLFGSTKESDKKDNQLQKQPKPKKNKTKYDPKELKLNPASYIPLPPSPNKWDLDERPDYSIYNNEEFKELFGASWEKKYTKVIKLAKELDAYKLKGEVSKVVAQAYRKQIIGRQKKEQFLPAARWSEEMATTVPEEFTDADKRRHNKIIEKLNNSNKKHTFFTFNIPKTPKTPLFDLSPNSPWQISNIDLIPTEDRPDPGLDTILFIADGTLYVDKTGNSKISGDHNGALKKIDLFGHTICERSINHGTYRIGHNPYSKYFSIMDAEGFLHIFDEKLNEYVTCNLKEDGRVKHHFRTIETNYWGEFRTQVRDVDVSSDGNAMLFTLADEAWCCDKNGNTIWGVRTPLKDGWERVVGRCSEQSSLTSNIIDSLNILGLSLPVTPNEIKQKYRELALANHPDRNPDNPGAHKKMQEINNAMKIATGIDPESLDIEQRTDKITYFKKTKPDQVIDYGGFQISFSVGDGTGQDWIYGATFCFTSTSAYLATYSGKIIEVNQDGESKNVYDLGAIPDEIVDTGDLLYFLTTTRLYIIRKPDKLIALVDIFQKGNLIMGKNGFGLLDKKTFRWFTSQGNPIGEVNTRDPIRAIYSSQGNCIIETRQNRATIIGLNIYEV